MAVKPLFSHGENQRPGEAILIVSTREGFVCGKDTLNEIDSRQSAESELFEDAMRGMRLPEWGQVDLDEVQSRRETSFEELMLMEGER